MPSDRPALRRWARHATSHTLLMVGQQALMAVGGILIVRGSDYGTYALYILAISLTLSVASVSDAGIITSLSANARRMASNTDAARAFVAEALRFRRRVARYAAAAVISLGAVLLIRAGATWWQIWTTSLLSVIAALCTLNASVNLALLRQEFLFAAAGRVQLMAAVIRVTMLPIILFPDHGMDKLLLLLALNVIASLYEDRQSAMKLDEHWARHAVKGGDTTTTPQELRGFLVELRTNARRQVPQSIFFVAQGQVLLAILAVSGRTLEIAAVSALSRYTLLFSLLGTVIASLGMPVLARASGLKVAVKTYLGLTGTYIVLALSGLGVLFLLTSPLLRLLGSPYEDYRIELLIMNAGGVATGLGVLLSRLNQGRAWLRFLWIFIPVSTVWTAILFLTVGFSSIGAAVTFSALSPIGGLVALTICAYAGAADERRRGDGVVANA